MHPTSAENMERCVRWYLSDSGRRLRIADLGSQSVNGSYRSMFHQDVDYVGFDLASGPGVDVVMESPYQIPDEPTSFDLVISGQMLEHCPHFWLLASEIQRILRPGGLAFLIAPSAGPVHQYPVDCYRFYPDAWQALADWSGLHLVHLWLDERGPWRDLVGVFGKDTEIEAVTRPPATLLATLLTDQSIPPDPGCAPLISDIYAQTQPKLCVEIGTAGSRRLPASHGRRILIESGVQPSEQVDQNLSFDCSADDFFFFLADEVITTAIDLAVINGRRAAACILRDVMHLERRMSPTGVIIITDAVPARDEHNVARIASLLRSERPDLVLNTISANGVGVLTIAELQPHSDVLWERYNPLVRKQLRENHSPIARIIPAATPSLASSLSRPTQEMPSSSDREGRPSPKPEPCINGSSKGPKNQNSPSIFPEGQRQHRETAVHSLTEKIPVDLAEYQDLVLQHGHTDIGYLQGHFERFFGTFRQFSRFWARTTDAHVLDIGAHWLHQSILFARAGFRVTAADFPDTLERRGVRALARAHGIDLLIYNELESGNAFDPIPDDSIDILLFTEILEHITFNPVPFWESVYRILRPGGRIIVTTPNFYAVGSRAWQYKRFLMGFGAGIDNLGILRTPTYGHHWKEYSRKEVCHYFRALSPDFQIHRALEVDARFEEPATVRARMSRFLLPQLYLEVDLNHKDHGITMKSSW